MTQLRVLIDDQAFSQRHGGISRYFSNLIRVFRAHPELGVEPVTPFRYVPNNYLLALDPNRYKRPWLIGGRTRVLHALNTALPPRPPRPELVHHTGYGWSQLRSTVDAPRVSTIHDMIPELFPADFDGFATHHAKRQFVARSDLVLCVSETTRRDLVRIYGAPAGRIRVTHLGVSSRFRPDAVRPAWLPEEYLLFVGHRQAYKNFLTLLAAFASVARRHPRLRLLCVGGTPFDPAETAAIERTGLADRVLRRVVADAELPGVYAGARVFVFPSRYEGFGLPILEAFRSGCPALLADTACFREVAGDAALFFPGPDPQALSAILDRVLSDAALRDAVVRHGHLRATSFSWLRTARRTAEAYRELR